MEDTEYKILSIEKSKEQNGKLTCLTSSSFFFLFFILGLVNNIG